MGIISQADKNNTRYKNLTALGTTALVSGGSSAWLHTVNVNISGADGNVVLINDVMDINNWISGQGVTVATIDTTSGNSGRTASYTYDVRLLSGLVVIVSGGVAGNVTLSYAP